MHSGSAATASVPARPGRDAVRPRGLRALVGERLADLHPAYFALSMATGIVSIGCHWLGLPLLARFLFWVNLPAFALLWVALLVRVRLRPDRFVADWGSHQRGPGFFTSVAAAAVLGVQFVRLDVMAGAAPALWWIVVALWAVCTYGIFAALSVRDAKPTIADGINGGWLLAVVATQAVCVLGCAVGPDRIAGGGAGAFVLASFWLFGGMLYLWMISLIFYRHMFFRFEPSDLMPPYWINMGAAAISTLAGCALCDAVHEGSPLAPLAGFVKGMTLLYWATATWWIPMLVILGVWRHGVRRLRLAYDPLYWGLVFPLGMYAVSTFRVAQTFDAPFLLGIARVFVTAALVAWALTFLGLAGRLLHLSLLALRSLNPTGPRGAPHHVAEATT